jgi:hypothetical protein
VRPTRAAAIARPAPPRAPHVKSCIFACCLLPAQRRAQYPRHWRCLRLVSDDQGYVDVRPARAAVLARPAPPRAPHVKSCIPACRLRRDLDSTHVTGNVSGWVAMNKATWMCVPRAPLRSLTRRRRVHHTRKVASPRVACAEF